MSRHRPGAPAGAAAADRQGRVILTGAGGNEVSQEDDELGHGVFTHYLLRGLSGRADADRNGEGTVLELFTYVSREVPRATDNRQHPKAKLDDADADIVLSFVKAEAAQAAP